VLTPAQRTRAEPADARRRQCPACTAVVRADDVDASVRIAKALVARQLRLGSLRAQGAGDIVVVVGGVIPAADYDLLAAAGVAAVFGPGSNICDAASQVLALVRQPRGAA
jgi:methylmalonyl-CoA mutase cobalamin-binding domain/chain